MGAPEDPAEAAKWTRKSAEQGDVEAQTLLGALYSNGEGVPQDHAESRKWTRLAALQGHPAAHNNLGSAYQFGSGVPQNNVMAHMWYNIAAAGGDKLAVWGKKRMAEKMTPEEISKAQTMATDCVKKSYINCGY